MEIKKVVVPEEEDQPSAAHSGETADALKGLRVRLVTMPWHPIDLPSLRVGLLHAWVSRTRPPDEVREVHGSLRWAEFLLRHSGGRLRPGDHRCWWRPRPWRWVRRDAVGAGAGGAAGRGEAPARALADQAQ
ncbi:hypothetical protein ACWC09_40245 [Streptomyces sp. NPDC001617]